MPDQTMINIGLAIICGGLGWMLNSLWQATKDLQNSDKAIIDRISSIEVLVAGKYITRQEFTALVTTLNQKLDDIQKAVNSKADR